MGVLRMVFRACVSCPSCRSDILARAGIMTHVINCLWRGAGGTTVLLAKLQI